MSAEDTRTQGTSLVATGLGVAALGAAGAAVGIACPLCVVAAPALVGFGIYKRWKGRAQKAAEEAEERSA